jgi:hypothetical protein
MAGVVMIIPCPHHALTSIGDLKRAIALYDSELPVNRLRFTVRRDVSEMAAIQDASSLLDPDAVLLLQDEQTLGQCGLGPGASVDMFVEDIAWRPLDRDLQEKLMAGGPVVFITDNWNGDGISQRLDAESGAAIAWTLTVRFVVLSKPC